MTRALADSYRAELVRAARKGLAFAPGTGEPESWAAPEPEPVTWYQHAVAYAEMKWPHLALHSRASLAVALSPATVASPAQVRAILAQVARARPELAAFFGCLYYAALRPEEAVPLRRANLILPARGRGKIILTAACPRTGSAWTSTGTSHEPTGLKHRPDGAIRVVPIPAVLVAMLCHHLGDHGTTTDGRLFRGARGGMLSESVYGRIWHAARRAALGPDLAATALARRPYDLRHAALSLWLNATGAPAEVAARAGNSARVLHEVYLHCTDGQEDTVSQRIEDALGAYASVASSSQCAKASGYTNRRHHPRPCPLSVREPAPGPAHSPRPPDPASPQHRTQAPAANSVSAAQTAFEAI
jgi:integrase